MRLTFLPQPAKLGAGLKNPATSGFPRPLARSVVPAPIKLGVAAAFGFAPGVPENTKPLQGGISGELTCCSFLSTRCFSHTHAKNTPKLKPGLKNLTTRKGHAVLPENNMRTQKQGAHSKTTAAGYSNLYNTPHPQSGETLEISGSNARRFQTSGYDKPYARLSAGLENPATSGFPRPLARSVVPAPLKLGVAAAFGFAPGVPENIKPLTGGISGELTCCSFSSARCFSHTRAKNTPKLRTGLENLTTRKGHAVLPENTIPIPRPMLGGV